MQLFKLCFGSKSQKQNKSVETESDKGEHQKYSDNNLRLSKKKTTFISSHACEDSINVQQIRQQNKSADKKYKNLGFQFHYEQRSYLEFIKEFQLPNNMSSVKIFQEDCDDKIQHIFDQILLEIEDKLSYQIIPINQQFNIENSVDYKQLCVISKQGMTSAKKELKNYIFEMVLKHNLINNSQLKEISDFNIYFQNYLDQRTQYEILLDYDTNIKNKI